ncbi:unnamed protein product [Mytilus edulis]|uniref:Ankyrin repeat protein n=1 Tax=Mytilus edulis TaxID=6550 RepID=A0A8S3R2A1_MYTED|nr:unnamed protein product [Mytilus edulis]
MEEHLGRISVGGSEVNRRAYDEKTALVIICSNFGVDSNEEYAISVITLLLKHNVDPNVQDCKGRTAIMYAMRNRKPKSVVDLLLKHDADPLTCDNLGKNAISFIQKEYWSQYFDSFSKFDEPPTASIGNTNVETIKAFIPSQTEEKRIHSLGYQEIIRRFKTSTKLSGLTCLLYASFLESTCTYIVI